MKIWFIEIGEPLPIEPEVRPYRYGMLAPVLASLGHEVTWWTSGFSHISKRQVCRQDADFPVNGYTLRVIAGSGYRRSVSWQRIRHQRQFAARFARIARQGAPPDVIISPIPTLEASEAAVRYAMAMHVPVVIDIRDEWPDEFVDLAPRPLRGLMRACLRSHFRRMHFICRQATGIMAVSRSFLDYGLSFSGRRETENDRVIPIGYESIPPDREKLAQARAFWLAEGLNPEAFICCFFGTIGNFFDLGTVIKAARILSQTKKVQFVLCGDGSSRRRYEKMAHDLPSVIFPGWVDAPRIAALMEMAAVGLAPYAKNARMSLPNKPFEYFSGSLPVVSSIQGELKALLEDHACGLTYPADSVDGLRVILEKLYDDRALCAQMGERGRRLVDSRFSSEFIGRELGGHLGRVVGNFRDQRKPGG